jgi:hypothetical protein
MPMKCRSTGHPTRKATRPKRRPAKPDSAKLQPKLSQTEEDLLSHMRHGYQLKTSPLGDNPVLHRLKDDTYVRADANRRTIETLQNRGLIGVAKEGDVLNPTVWRLAHKAARK